MNKKAMEPWMMVTLFLSAFFIVAVSVRFVPRTIDTAEDFINVKLEDWGLKTETTPLVVIDEELIEEGTQKEVETIPNDPQSGFTIIIKQPYAEGGWNLEVPKSVFQKAKETYTGPGWLLLMLTSGEEEPSPLLENVQLLQILSSDKLKGIITINGRQYAHTINKDDASPETPDLIWYKNPVIENGAVTSGTEITAEEVRTLLLTELYEEAQ